MLGLRLFGWANRIHREWRQSGHPGGCC